MNTSSPCHDAITCKFGIIIKLIETHSKNVYIPGVPKVGCTEFLLCLAFNIPKSKNVGGQSNSINMLEGIFGSVWDRWYGHLK